MKTFQNEKEAAKKIIDIFSKKETVSRHFSSDIGWLEERISLWNKNYIRVGLVGVTSSGKSTLLNALLGEDILPTAVRPSSGTLITCSKGARTEATVYFEDGTSISVPKRQLRSQLEKYGDESFNEHNKYKVRIIDVKSPNFLLPETIQIIDSPGLDAHGLERHEQITMELLLPTVDLCMYVVTLKANSDLITHNILQTIYEHQKPLIIVQNMLDSVEAKTGKHGVILKAKKEVALEHQKRVENILHKVSPRLVNFVEIVQISAKAAVDGRRETNAQKLENSRVPELVNRVKKHTNSLHPKLYADRIMQIHRHLLGLREKEERFLGDAVLYEQAVQEEKQELEKLKRQEGVVRNKVQQKKELLTAQVTSLETLTKNAVTRIRKLDRKNLDECKQILDGVKNQAVGIETKFIQGVRSLDKEVQTLLSTLNLQTKDYENDVLPAKMGTDKHFSVKRKIEKEPYRAEKSGVGSGVARLFGSLFDKDWGYETRYREYEVVDLEAISKELAAYREKFSKQIAGYLEQWQRRAEAFLQRASAEIRRKTDSLHTKSKSALKKDEAVEVLFQLQNIMDALEKEGTKLRKARLNNAKVTAVDEKSSVAKLSISEGVVGLYQLSHQLMSIPFRTCWSAVQERNQQKHKGLKRSIVWGWDSASLIQFLQRYPGIQMQDQEEEQFTHTGLFISRKKEEIVVVNEAKLQPDSMSGLLKLAKQGQYNIYILFNVIQIGAAEKAFQNSKLLQLPYTRQQPINSVLQSFTELKNADRVQEGLQILFEKLEQWDILQSGELLLNDRNPLYSMISLDLTKPKTILADAQEVLRRAREDYQYLLANPGEEQHLRNFVKGLIDARGGLKK